MIRQTAQFSYHVGLVGFLLVVDSCSSPTEPPKPLPVIDPTYPAVPDFDYRPRTALAHAALPLFDVEAGSFDGPSRIWVKGSSASRRVRAGVTDWVELDPPFYTAMLEVEPGAHTVEFDGPEPVAVEVEAVSAAALNADQDDVLILGYGCFDPFDLHGDGAVHVSPGDGTHQPGRKTDAYPRFHALRRAFRDAALGRETDAGMADLILGVGDQVYVEPAHDRYDAYGTKHPLSAWTIEARPQPRLPLQRFVRFLDDTYRAFWSFDLVDDALRRVPSVMIWDDHEIRDGWGSQGDEHLFLGTYYASARSAFLEHQFARGPRPVETGLAAPRAPLHQSLEIGNVPIFVMDQRSARDLRVPQVLGDEQWGAFERWIRAIDPVESPACLIVSPLPILFRNSDLKELAGSFKAEIWDDLIDGWSSPTNRPELDKLTLELIDAHRRGLHVVILSGDMHTSGILRGHYRSESGAAEQVFAQEVVVSGMASLVNGSDWKAVVSRRGSFFGDSISIDGVEVRLELGLSNPVPNFGTLRFRNGAVRVQLYQAVEEGMITYELPLVWGSDAPSLEAAASGARRKLAD